MLCENPDRKTGLTTLYHAFVERSLAQFQDLEWVVYVGPEQEWDATCERVEVVRKFPANDRTLRRLVADHFRVAGDASRRGAECLVTTGFVPLIRTLPVAMHMLSLQHLNVDNRVGLARRFYRKFSAESGLERAELVITNTDFAVSQILSVNPACKDRLLQSYEGLDHDAFHSMATKAEVTRLREVCSIEPGYLLWISNFYPYKQAELLVDAYAGLSEKLRKAMPLVMVGGGGWGNGLESVSQRIAEHGLEDHVTLLGWVADDLIAPLYRNARVFALASREETFGRCVLEAMACGVPCIVNDIEVMHEVTQEHAVIVDFNDRKSSVQGLRAVAEDEDLRKRLIRNGKKRSKRFSFDLLAGERVDAIRTMLENQKLLREGAGEVSQPGVSLPAVEGISSVTLDETDTEAEGHTPKEAVKL